MSLHVAIAVQFVVVMIVNSLFLTVARYRIVRNYQEPKLSRMHGFANA